MRLGTRWPLGSAAPSSLPPVVLAAVRSVETELAESEADTQGWHWTLTWLEGRPIVDLDDGTRIRYLPAEGHAVVTSVALDEAEDDEG